MKVSIGEKSWEIPPPDYHVRSGKRGQLWMADIVARLYRYFEYRCTCLPSGLRHSMSVAKLSRRTGISIYMLRHYLVHRDMEISWPDFDAILQGLDISLRELVTGNESAGPSRNKPESKKRYDIEQHLRNISRQCSETAAFMDRHVPNPHFAKLRRHLGKILIETEAIMDLFDLPHHADDAGKPESRPEIPEYGGPENNFDIPPENY